MQLVVAIVDADHFKRVNDTLSHGIGDRVICDLATVLQAGLPAGLEVAGARAPFVARLGGEEFLVALPGLSPAAATAILTGIRAAVANHRWSPLIGRLSLTVSIGATVALLGDSQSTILARADHNLYVAKAAGRNHVVDDDGLLSQLPDPAPLLTLPDARKVT
jgi:diguanylate cyclase (GGDEF)-like protein